DEYRADCRAECARGGHTNRILESKSSALGCKSYKRKDHFAWDRGKDYLKERCRKDRRISVLGYQAGYCVDYSANDPCRRQYNDNGSAHCCFLWMREYNMYVTHTPSLPLRCWSCYKHRYCLLCCFD